MPTTKADIERAVDLVAGAFFYWGQNACVDKAESRANNEEMQFVIDLLRQVECDPVETRAE